MYLVYLKQITRTPMILGIFEKEDIAAKKIHEWFVETQLLHMQNIFGDDFNNLVGAENLKQQIHDFYQIKDFSSIKEIKTMIKEFIEEYNNVILANKLEDIISPSMYHDGIFYEYAPGNQILDTKNTINLFSL